MDGILEQILAELKEIKKLMSEKSGLYNNEPKNRQFNDTLKIKEAAEYLGITEYRLRMLTIQGEIKHFMAGNRYLYKRKSLAQWLEDVQDNSDIVKR